MTAHGRSRYKTGCRCFTCRLAESQYAAEHAAGLRRKAVNYMPLEPVREHLARLSAKGVGYRRVAELAGINPKTVRGWLFLDRAMCRKVLGEAALAVSEDARPRWWLDGTGTRRRIQALGANGWPLAQVARRAGWHRKNMVEIFNRNDVFPRTAEKVAALYGELWNTAPPPSRWVTRAHALAARNCWFPPGAWDDDTIDNPDALPCLLPPVEPVPDDVELLVQHLVAGHPVTPTGAAQYEIVRRLPDRKPAEIAVIGQMTAYRIAAIRTVLAGEAARAERRAAC